VKRSGKIGSSILNGVTRLSRSLPFAYAGSPSTWHRGWQRACAPRQLWLLEEAAFPSANKQGIRPQPIRSASVVQAMARWSWYSNKHGCCVHFELL